MTTKFRTPALIWALLTSALLAVLFAMPVQTASATTVYTAPYQVIPDASGKAALLTATRLAGTENRFSFTTGALHVNPLRVSSAPQFVQVDWELQTAVPATKLQWTKVQYLGPGYGLYSVANDPEDPEGYIYVPLTGGRDLPAETFATRVVSGGAQAYRVVAKLTWTDRATGAQLGSATLKPTTAGDLACQGTTAAHCWVNDIYPDPKEPYIVLR